ncbi:hypothetical protein KY284_033346 [Solanum tuberosum]|nr:hypothetical protein KY284_033346 [Solanum tuberosum]
MEFAAVLSVSSDFPLPEAGVTVLVGVPLGAEARHHVVAAIAVLHIAAEKKLHMLMEMDLKSVTEAEAE